jgi:hypothetical protein
MLSLVWKNKKDRENYEPIIKAISERLIEVERYALGKVSRQVALQFLTLDSILELVNKGYVVIPVAKSEMGIRCIVHDRGEFAWLGQSAFTQGDDEKLGNLLGFPYCCIKHFSSNWKSGQSDPTRFMGSPDIYVVSIGYKSLYEYSLSLARRPSGIPSSLLIQL